MGALVSVVALATLLDIVMRLRYKTKYSQMTRVNSNTTVEDSPESLVVSNGETACEDLDSSGKDFDRLYASHLESMFKFEKN